MSASNYLEDALLNAVLRNTPYTSTANVYIAFFTANPGEDGAGAEVTGGSYARTAIAFGAPSNGVCLNSAQIVSPTATVSWGVVTHFGVMDAATAGALLYYAALDTQRTVGVGVAILIPAEGISITLT